MAKQGLDGTDHVVHSSITLLQERFRQLQRAKEMREERELLRQMLTDHHHESEQRVHMIPAGTGYNEPKGLFFQSGFTVSHYKPPPSPQTLAGVSMHLQPNNYLQNKHDNYLLQVADHQAPAGMGNMCSNSIAGVPRTNNFNDSDVDTSLHL